MTTEEINTIIELFDTDNDGNINYSEFSQGCVAMAQQIAQLVPTSAYREEHDAKRASKIKPRPKAKTSKRPIKARPKAKVQPRQPLPDKLSQPAAVVKPSKAAPIVSKALQPSSIISKPSQPASIVSKPSQPTTIVSKPSQPAPAPNGKMSFEPIPPQDKDVKVRIGFSSTSDWRPLLSLATAALAWSISPRPVPLRINGCSDL